MRLDEAIQRENKIAKENQKIADTQIVFDDVSISELYCDDTEVIEEHLSNYRKCAEYHKQLAEWLEDFKELKSTIQKNLQEQYALDRRTLEMDADSFAASMSIDNIIMLYIQQNENPHFFNLLKKFCFFSILFTYISVS